MRMNYQILLFTCLLILGHRRRALTCKDIALLGYFDTGHCCSECHTLAAKEGDERALIHDDDGHGHSAVLCCHASLMIHGFQGIPCHSEEYAS
jgi:hypothetical protein